MIYYAFLCYLFFSKWRFQKLPFLNALTAHQGEPLDDVHGKLPNKVHDKLPNKLQAVMDIIEEEPKASAATVALELGVSEQMARSYFATLGSKVRNKR